MNKLTEESAGMELDIKARAADIFVLKGDPIVTATHVSPFLHNLCDGSTSSTSLIAILWEFSELVKTHLIWSFIDVIVKKFVGSLRFIIFETSQSNTSEHIHNLHCLVF